MNLEELGYNSEFEKFRIDQNLELFERGRIIAEHKGRYIVGTEKGEFEAEITGNIRYAAGSREDFPVVGDWVSLVLYDAYFAIIHKIFPRFSVLKRQAVGRAGEIQMIAANVNCAFILQAVDRDFNLNRLERYLTICYSSKISPVIIMTKTDLTDRLRTNKIIEDIKQRLNNVPVIPLSNETRDGYEALKDLILRGKTYCLLGSSGVGKSTLLNNLTGSTLMRTGAISQSTNKGKHVTSHRELSVIESGGILIDNPGMREVGIVDAANGLETTFEYIVQLSLNCRFKNCTHTMETGCYVIKAVKNGELDIGAYENYLKMENEKAYFETTAAERKRKEKIFGKIIKDYSKNSGFNTPGNIYRKK